MSFLAGMFSEPTGEPSFSRVASGLVLFASLGWISYVVFKNHGLPDFTGVTAYSTYLLGSLYGINKVVTKLSDTFKTPPVPPVA